MKGTAYFKRVLTMLLLAVATFIAGDTCLSTVKAQEIITVSSRQELVNAINSGSNVSIKLNSDITGYGIQIPEDTTVNIDLNGKKIDGELYKYPGTPGFLKKSIFIVYGNLVVDDTSADKTGKITGGSNSGVNVRESASFTLNGGSITDNYNALFGGGVNVFGGNFTMNGGELYLNVAAINAQKGAGVGGGIFMCNGNEKECVVNINGGVISRNFAKSGGGIYVDSGTLNITGGVIGSTTDFNHYSNQVAEFKMGSGIFVNEGYVSMSGGSVYGHEKDGVTVDRDGVFVMRGGKIYDNLWGVYNKGTFYMYGGQMTSSRIGFSGQEYGVIVDDGGTFVMMDGEISESQIGVAVQGVDSLNPGNPSLFHMAGGKITKNTGKDKGSGLYISDGATVAMSGGEITGNACPDGDGAGVYVDELSNFALIGGKISDNTVGAGHKGGGVFLSGRGTCQVADAPVVTGNYAGNVENNIYLTSPTIEVAGVLSEGAKIGITAPSYPYGPTEGYNDNNPDDLPGLFFRSDLPGHHITRNPDNKEVLITDCGDSVVKVNAKAETCTEDGCIAHYKCTKCGELFTDAAGTKYTSIDYVTLKKLGHDYGTPSYSWSADNTSITATRVCKHDSQHKETEEGTITVSEVKSEDCLTKGYKTYTATFNNTAFATQIKTVETEVGPHKAGEEVVENIKERTCTTDGSCDFVKYCVYCNTEIARRKVDYLHEGHKWTDWEQTKDKRFRYCIVCGLSETEAITWQTCNHELELVPQVDATCITYGMKEYYRCKNCKAVFASKETTTPVTKDEMTALGIPIDKENGHQWTESTKANEKEADCTNTGGYDEVQYCKLCGISKVINKHTNEALGHSYGEPFYIWADDFSTVTAKRICARNPEHVDEETVRVKIVKVPATCTEKGKETYTAEFTAPFKTQVKSIDIADKGGHTWGEASYTWADDNSKVTASHTCTECGKVETDEAIAYSRVTKTATCTRDGEITYSALFNNKSFAAQTKTATIEKTGHKWGEATYTWSDDCTSCLGSRVCQNEAGEEELEEADVTSEITKPATCTEKGETTYTATFERNGFTTQIKKLTNVELDPDNHVPAEVIKENEVAATCLADGSYDEVVKCSKCDKELSREKKTVKATGHKWGQWTVKKAATVDAEGLEERSCSVCDAKETRATDKLAPAPDANKDDKKQTASDNEQTQYSKDDIDKQIIKHDGEADLKNSDFTLLMAKGVPVSKKSIKITWKKVPGASEYIIYGNKCGKKNKYKRITSVTSTKLIRKKLKVGTYYKHLVVAVDKNGKILATSKTIHCVTNGGKNGNNTKVIPSKKKVTISVNKTKKITAKLKTKKPVRIHRDIAWESDDPDVADVDNKGKIKGIGKGKCNIYAYAQNGVYAKIKVTVK